MKSLRKPVLITILVLVVLGALAFVSLKKSAPPPLPVETVKPVEPAGPKIKLIGKSVEGRPLTSYTFGNGKTHLLFAGGMHGGYEWNSVLLAYQVIDYLTANPSVVPASLTVSVIPSLNPDGVFKVTGKEGRFTVADVSVDKEILASGRFNAHGVDLNRNFACKWKPESMWRSKVVSAGTAPFSEPEAVALRGFVLENTPRAVVFWHSQANAVYASECEEGISQGTLDVMNTYARASGYPAVTTFDSYEISGDSEGWLASIGIPAITVELKTHETVEFERNLAGVKALLGYYATKP